MWKILDQYKEKKRKQPINRLFFTSNILEPIITYNVIYCIIYFTVAFINVHVVFVDLLHRSN